MPSSIEFNDGAVFRASVQRDAEPGYAWGTVTFTMEVGDSLYNHPLDTADVAAGLRALFEAAGYTVGEFTSTLPATLDEEATSAAD